MKDADQRFFQRLARIMDRSTTICFVIRRLKSDTSLLNFSNGTVAQLAEWQQF